MKTLNDIRIVLSDYSDVNTVLATHPIPHLKMYNNSDRVINVYYNNKYLITLLPYSTQYAMRGFDVNDELCFYDNATKILVKKINLINAWNRRIEIYYV